MFIVSLFIIIKERRREESCAEVKCNGIGGKPERQEKWWKDLDCKMN